MYTYTLLLYITTKDGLQQNSEDTLNDCHKRPSPTKQTIRKNTVGKPPWANEYEGSGKLHRRVPVFCCKRRPPFLRWWLVCYPFGTNELGTAKSLRRYQGSTRSAVLRPIGTTLGIRSHGIQDQNVSRFCRIWRRKSLQRVLSRPGCRNARC